MGLHAMSHHDANYFHTHLLRHLDMYADDAERLRVLKSLVPPARVPKARGELRF